MSHLVERNINSKRDNIVTRLNHFKAQRESSAKRLWLILDEVREYLPLGTLTSLSCVTVLYTYMYMYVLIRNDIDHK